MCDSGRLAMSIRPSCEKGIYNVILPLVMDRIIRDRRGQLLLFMVMIFATFMDGLDGTIVSVVLPDMAAFFDISTGDSSWIITVYFLATAGLILIFGKICDNGAIKNVLMYGLAIFTMGSVFCGFSVSFPMLLAARAIQGVGAAMLACSAIMLTVKFLPKELTALGLVATSVGYSLGSAFGPVIGGVISEFMSWEWIFFINVPVGIIAVISTWRIIPKDEFEGMQGFDFKGAALLFVAMVAGLYCLESTPSHGISNTTLVLIAVFAVTFALFVRRSIRFPDPVVDLRLFRYRRMDAAIVVMLIANVCYMGCLYLLPFYITKVLGYGTMESGFFILIAGVVTLVVSMKAGGWIVKYGSRPFAIFACLMLTVASLIFVFVEYDPIPLLVTGLVLMGLMWGFGGGAMGERVINNVPDSMRGAGSSLNTFIIYFGAALGTATYSVFFNTGSGSASMSILDLTPEVFMDGFVFAMAAGTVLCLIALLFASVRDDGSDS